MGEAISRDPVDPSARTDAPTSTSRKAPAEGASSITLTLPQGVLGRDEGLPVPFAVFSVSIDEETHQATDARYVYVSREYCKAISRDVEGVVDHSFLEIGEGDKDEWLAQCYRVVAHGETLSGFRYDALVRDWTCYTMAPSVTEGCCVYTFMRIEVDDRQRRQLMATADARTSLFVSEMLSELAAEQSYDAAMNGMLAMMSKIIHADRLSVFECFGEETRTTFELCAEGVEPQLGAVFGATKDVLRYWFRNVTNDRVVLVPNVSIIERMSEPLYRWCLASGVRSLMAAPFFNDGEIVGFLGAYNYQIDETVDLNRLFEAVSTFIAARIDNRQLIDSLKRAGSHDMLTGLLNRRGADVEIGGLFESDPQGHYVLVLIDLDDFKRINDVYGHSIGDEALRALATALTRTFPEEAIISRNGGDEFLVMLSGGAAMEVSSILAKLTQRGVEFESDGVRHQLTMSIGYARYPEQTHDLHDLFSKADAALYAVKLTGKAGFGKYTTEVESLKRYQLGFSARDLLESIPYPLLITRADAQGDILFASEGLADLLGFVGTHELMRSVSASMTGIITPDDHILVGDALGRLVRGDDTETTMHLGFRMVTQGGGLTDVQASCRLADLDESGKMLYLLISPARPS